MRILGVSCLSLFFFITDISGSDALSIAHEEIPLNLWLTGPLLATYGITQPSGTVDVEPFLVFSKTYANPRFFSLNPLLSFTIGITKWLDFEFQVPYIFNEAEQRWFQHFQDILLTLGVQAIRTTPNDWVPNLRVIFQENFPAGKYQKLDPTYYSVESTGQGAYQTGVGTNFEQIYSFSQGRYLNLLLTLLYTISTTVSVEGFNTYGGSMDTSGTVQPGKSFNADVAFEYTLTQHWVTAMDIIYTKTGASLFQGNPGSNGDEPAQVGLSASQSVTLAPALEYNFSSNWGIIAGVWFSVYVHNTQPFVSGMIAVNYSN